MGVVLLQILQWILRIVLFLILLIAVLMAIILIVPIRYRAEGEFLEKKPGVRGKITWFFYLIYMRFCYEEEFRIQVRVLGVKVFDSAKREKEPKKAKSKKKTDITAEDELAVWEKEMKAEAKEEAELAKQITEKKAESSQNVSQNQGESLDHELKKTEDLQKESENTQDNTSEKVKKSLLEKIGDIKAKIQDTIQKVKDIIAKIQAGKLKAEHYLELWNRNETQITFSRAKKKFIKMVKAILPKKWEVRGNIGLKDPCITGQLMGVLGAMYPVLGNRVQIIPDFENEVLKIEGKLKGHIRLGNLLYQLVSLLLNRHCFKFIKLIFDELGGSKKGKKKQKV